MKPCLLFIFLFFGAASLAAQADCYQNLRSEGLSLLKKKSYRQAVDKFFAARYCPDKPTKDDLDALIKKTQDQWVAALDQAINASKTAQQKTAAALAKADSALTLANNIIDAFYFYKDSFALAYKNNYYGFIDKQGKAVIDYQYQEALPFDNTGYARVKRSGTTYLIDTKGVEYRLATEVNQLYSNVVALDLRDRGLDTFPMPIVENPQLKILFLFGNRLTSLPEEFGKLTNLQTLYLSTNQLTSLPESIGKLDSLHTLDVSYNHLRSLPATIGQLHQLQILDVTGSELTSLPETIGELQKLQSLILTYNPLVNLPVAIIRLSHLENLNLHRSKLTNLPEFIGQLTNLRSLNISRNVLTSLPESIGQLTSLQTLELFDNQLTRLPESIGRLHDLQTLVLYNNPLASLPESIGQLRNLQILSVSGSPLTSLPASIVQLKNLQKLYLSNNQITSLPEKIGQCNSLQVLNLYQNELMSLPASIGQLSQLHTLDLSVNNLTSLPATIGQLNQLQILNLNDNKLTDLPTSIGQLSSLQKLDLSGNEIGNQALKKLSPIFYIENLAKFAKAASGRENYALSLNYYQALANQKTSTKIKQEAANNCSNITWDLLLKKEFKRALEAALLAQQFDATNANLYTNLPLAYLFNNQFEKAKVIYLSHKDKMYDKRSYKEVFLNDFDDLEAAGITHPDIPKIITLLKK